MAYLLKKSVFIHTPKTAGQWVAAALDREGLIVETIGPVHTSPDEISNERAVKERQFTFTFVRHPASWYRSMWAHQMDEGWGAIDDPEWFTPRWIEFWAKFTRDCHSNSFDQFVRNCIDHYPGGLVSSLYEAYTAECDFVGKQENLSADLQTALDQAGERYNPARLLSTQPRNVRGQKPRRKRATHYTRDLIELISKTETKTIKRYSYDSVLD